ncbi:hypothetical protein SAMN05421813_1303 [Daejeonella rubra]|uniref:Uncharacterized protein n=1 Tax=Daejeonella rubra TaxID=990371 RepID=A0A1G9XCW5_9SPHI|nr:hypothetical protein [Daejeonella rubra]SDM94600.1 hypothetical protein SAMN05421813_1303 [Daejeonella rubra]
MKKELARLIFSIVFLFIFFIKMVISIAPLLADHLDSKIVNAVIMQLEIETHSSKGADQAKDSLNKGEWLSGLYKFNFEQPHKLIANKEYIAMQDYHIEAFYPTIPTPPPNC